MADMKSLVSTLLAALTVLAIGCGEDNAPLYDHGPVRPPPDNGPYVFPEKAHTGCDGVNRFKVPFSTNLKGTVTWKLADPSLGQVYTVNAPKSYEEFGENWALVETFKAGTTTITATDASGQSASAELIIAQYDPAVVQAGRDRYYDMSKPGGSDEACYTCHGSVQGADHSPLEMSWFEDADILAAVLDGKYPSDGYVLKNVDHRWTMTEAQKAGIVPFLRQLQPKGIY
jgi:hypothetical protein